MEVKIGWLEMGLKDNCWAIQYRLRIVDVKMDGTRA